MAESAPGQGQSKSAKRRAAQKRAKETTAAVEEQPVVAEPAPKATAKAKAKAKAVAAPPQAPEPVPEVPGASAKSKAKAKKPKAPAADEDDAPVAPARDKQRIEDMVPTMVDDGTGGEWESVSGVSRKQVRANEKKETLKQIAASYGSATTMKIHAINQTVVGFDTAAPAKNEKPAAGQSVNAIVTAKETAATKPSGPPVCSSTIEVPEPRIGIIIGPGGATMKTIMEKTGAKIDCDGKMFTVMGTSNAVAGAEKAIRDIIEKGYTSLTFDDFNENAVIVHHSSFPDIIGKEGKVIRKLKEALKVEVTIPKTAPNSKPDKKYKVTIAGPTEGVEKAKEVITNIATYYHDELTHPDETHAEIEVPEWQYRFLIGTKGSEMRHIQKNFRVRVFIPREHSFCRNVLVVGEKDSVVRAAKYIEKVLWESANQTKGRDREGGGGGDYWQEEEDEEDWMRQYMYRR